MAYTRITKTRSGKSAIRYALEESSHKEGMDRVLTASGSNLNPEFAKEQMQTTWEQFGKADGDVVQMYRIIQSFGLDELNPDNEEDVATANAIGQEFANEMYPDRQSLIVTQADGKGGKLHNHVLVNSVSFVDGRSLRGNAKEFVPIAEKTNEVMKRHGMNPPPVPKGTRNKRTMAEHQLAKAGEYVWKDDLKVRIEQGASFEGITDEESFIEHMKDVHGVGVRYRGNDKDLNDESSHIKGVSYDFVGDNGKKYTSRAKELGRDFQSVALQEHFDENIELQERTARQAAQVEQVEDNVLDFGFDLDAELNAMTAPRKRSKVKPKSSSGSNEIKERIEAKKKAEVEAKAEAERAEQERIEQAEMEQLRQDEIKHREEVERLEKARIDAEREEEERKAKAEQERKLQEQQEEQAKRDAIKERIDIVKLPNVEIKEELVDEFMTMDTEFEGRKHPISGKSFTDMQKFHIGNMRVSEREKEQQQQGTQQAVEQVEQMEDEGPDL